MTCKLVYLARRASTVAREDWPRTWRSHAIFASQFPVLEARIDWMRYCNRIDIALPGVSMKHDGVAVAASDSVQGLNGDGFSDADRALIDQDELRVFDMLTPEFTYYCEEQVICEGSLGEAAIFSFLRRRPEISHAEFDERWNGDHLSQVHRAAATRAATRYVHNRPLHDPLPLFPFDGIAEAWFATADHAVAALNGDARDPVRDDLAGFCDFAQSVVMLTSVCHRWPKS